MNKQLNNQFPNLTFVIPFMYDDEYRLQNLYYILNILGHFNANVIVIEQGYYQHFTNTDFYFDKAKVSGTYHFIPNLEVCQGLKIILFYRTKIINIGLKKVHTKFAAIYDTDVFFEWNNYEYAYKKLQEGNTFVYPYDGRFVEIDRQSYDNGIIKENESFANGSYGGAVFLNLEEYKKYGLENENLIGWSPDDIERHTRVSILEGTICRIEGKCYHIYHPKTEINSSGNPFSEKNIMEYHKVMQMTKNELQEYVRTW